MKLFTIKNLIAMFKDILKGRSKFDLDYSLVRITYDNGIDKNPKLLKISQVITSDIYTNVELILVDVPENELSNHSMILKKQEANKLNNLNNFVKKNTEEYKFEKGKIVEARDGNKELSQEEIERIGK